MDAYNWYWLVGGKVYSSARNIYVAESDADYISFLTAGKQPVPIASLAELGGVLVARAPGLLPSWLLGASDFVQPAVGAYDVGHLKSYAAARRYDAEIAGIVVDGQTIATDRDSQAMINGAFAFATANPALVIQYKAASGFVSLTADQVKSIAQAVGAHVQACFAKEGAVTVSIDSGAVTDLAAIDQLFAAA